MGLAELTSWMLFGLIAGGIAKFIMPGKDPGGCLVTMLIGIAGALIGGFIATTVLGFRTVAGFNLRALLVAISGSLLLLLAYRIIARRRD